jgi:outer membrane lipoprotein carrier protein
VPHSEPATRPGLRRGGLLLLVLLALALCSGRVSAVGPAGAPASAGEEILRRLAAAFENMETYQAEFIQTQSAPGMDDGAVSSGTLSLRRPNLFRLEYDEPKGHLQVSDGRTVWTYVPENKEVLSTRLEEGAGQGGDLLRWILNNSRALPSVDDDLVGGRRVQRITLVPAEGVGLSRVRIWTPPGSSDLAQYEIMDSSGNLSTYRLVTVRRNPRLKADLFRFTPPKGIPVVEVGTP